ncbi:MAG TPA: 30S ribosomal protein S1, partial [Balneolaceae bacterium]|nr:30S ribosomal protein S1 [Balneolaceae bacterium]
MTEETKQEEQGQESTEEKVEETTVQAEESAEETQTSETEAADEVAEEQEREREETLTHVFSGDVEGEVYNVEDLQRPSDEYSDEEYEEMVGMYENTLNEIEEKEIVTGRVVSVDEKYVVVDIGFK